LQHRKIKTTLLHHMQQEQPERTSMTEALLVEPVEHEVEDPGTAYTVGETKSDANTSQPAAELDALAEEKQLWLNSWEPHTKWRNKVQRSTQAQHMQNWMHWQLEKHLCLKCQEQQMQWMNRE